MKDCVLFYEFDRTLILVFPSPSDIFRLCVHCVTMISCSVIGAFTVTVVRRLVFLSVFSAEMHAGGWTGTSTDPPVSK